MEYTDIKELPNSYGNYFVDGLGRVFDSSMCEIPISVIMDLAANFLGLAKHHVYKLIKENKIISNKYLGSFFYIKECLGPTIE